MHRFLPAMRVVFQLKALNMRRLDEYAREINAKHALFLFDCCFSGSVFAMSRAVPEEINYKAALPVRQFITSGSADETVPDKSIFCRQLVAALDGEADLNSDKYVTGSELGMFLHVQGDKLFRKFSASAIWKERNPNLDKGDFVSV